MNTASRERILQTELRLANAELARLRRRVNERGAHGKRLDRAYVDAVILAGFHIAFEPTTRAYAFQFAGMSNHRWENARALLKLARVHNGRHWLAHDLATIEARLAKAREQALESPVAFWARLPRHARPPGE